MTSCALQTCEGRCLRSTRQFVTIGARVGCQDYCSSVGQFGGGRMYFLKPDTLTALRGFARKLVSTAAIALLSMTMSLGCGTSTDRAVFVATAYVTDSSIPSSDAQRVAAAQARLLDSGGHDFEFYYELFQDAQGDLGRALAIIDMATTAYPKHVINIAAYVNRDDPAALTTICSTLESYLCVPFAREETCDQYLADCFSEVSVALHSEPWRSVRSQSVMGAESETAQTTRGGGIV